MDDSPQFWPRLLHICRKWRHIVFASQRALHLRLLFTHGTPVLKTLDCWPTLPIVVQYGELLAPCPPSIEDEDNIIAALKQSGRVISINLTVTNSLLEKLSAIERPFSELEDLVLLSRDNVLLTLPSAFRWGLRLRTLHLTRPTIPALPELLSHSTGLVDLQLYKIPNLGSFPPGAFADALDGMNHLRSLSLHFLSTFFSRNVVGLHPQSSERVVLPALTCLKYEGTSRYLNDLVARIDAPRLGDIDIGFLNEPEMDASQVAGFINRIDMQKSHRRADILSLKHAISISFTQPEAPSRFGLQISCKLLARQLLHMARICNGLSASLGVEDLRISVPRPTSGHEDDEREEWLDLTRAFRGTKWVYLAGEHSTNIVFALQHSEMLRHRRETVLPALYKLYIQEPEPRHARLQDAIVSFVHSRRHSCHIIAVEYERPRINDLLRTGTTFSQCSSLSRTNVLGVGPFSQQVMIQMLSDEVLLCIFHHYLHDSPNFWYTLSHVCQKWRRIVLNSPLGLHLQLYCTYGTPVLKALKYWPLFPLVVNYGRSPMLGPPSPEDEENIIATLEKSDRVSSITLAVTNSLLEKISAIKKPFSELEDLVLLSQDKAQLTLPSTFWWGHRLRTLHSTRIALPSLPQLLLPSQNLVDLQLSEIPGVGYFSPEAFANALCGMTQLETLSLHFLSLPPRRNFVSLPPSPGDRVVLPALTHFKYRGTSKYLDILVARIDAFRLEDIDITFYSQPTLDILQLGLFVGRVELWRPPSRADILSSPGAISITLTQPEPLSTRLGLQVSCEQLDWKLFTISQICDHFSSFLFSVENLGIETAGSSTVSDDIDDEQWLGLIRAFGGAKELRVASELATDISRALRLADEGHEFVLPALQKLHVLQPVSIAGPLWDSVESFVTQRQLSSLPVQTYVRFRRGIETFDYVA